MSFGRPAIDPAQRDADRRARIAAQARPSTVPKLHVGVIGGEVKPMAGQATPKPQTVRSEKWLAAVRGIDNCVLCGAPGVEPAHRNEGKGGAQKTSDCLTAALCRTCHREADQGKSLTREARRAMLDRAIVLTLERLVLAGKVRLL